jgi:hypothetical protein
MCACVVRHRHAFGREAFMLLLALVVNVVPVDVMVRVIVIVADHRTLIEGRRWTDWRKLTRHHSLLCFKLSCWRSIFVDASAWRTRSAKASWLSGSSCCRAGSTAAARFHLS